MTLLKKKKKKKHLFRSGGFLGSVGSGQSNNLFFLALFGKYLDYMLVKFEQNRMVQTIQNFELLTENG